MAAGDDSVSAVQHEPRPNGGRWFIELGDGTQAEMTYRNMPGNRIAIDHTYTPPAHRGQNVAHRLMHHAVAEARAAGTPIVPYCAYAVTQARRHRDEWADILADG